MRRLVLKRALKLLPHLSPEVNERVKRIWNKSDGTKFAVESKMHNPGKYEDQSYFYLSWRDRLGDNSPVGVVVKTDDSSRH